MAIATPTSLGLSWPPCKPPPNLEVASHRSFHHSVTPCTSIYPPWKLTTPSQFTFESMIFPTSPVGIWIHSLNKHEKSHLQIFQHASGLELQQPIRSWWFRNPVFSKTTWDVSQTWVKKWHKQTTTLNWVSSHRISAIKTVDSPRRNVPNLLVLHLPGQK